MFLEMEGQCIPRHGFRHNLTSIECLFSENIMHDLLSCCHQAKVKWLTAAIAATLNMAVVPWQVCFGRGTNCGWSERKRSTTEAMKAVKITEQRLGQSRTSLEPGFRNMGNPSNGTESCSRITANTRVEQGSRDMRNPNNSTNQSSRIMGKSTGCAQKGSRFMGKYNTHAERGLRNTVNQNCAERGPKVMVNPNTSTVKGSRNTSNTNRQVSSTASAQLQNNKGE